KSIRRRETPVSRGSKHARIGACISGSRTEVNLRFSRGRRRHMVATREDNLWYVPYILYNLVAERDASAALVLPNHRRNPHKWYDILSTLRFLPLPFRNARVRT